MNTEYTPNPQPIIFSNILKFADDAEIIDQRITTNLARGPRHVMKMHSKVTKKDISAVWHGREARLIRDDLCIHSSLHMENGGSCEIFTVSRHGHPHRMEELLRPIDYDDSLTRKWFYQSAMRWINNAGWDPRIWIGHGSSAESVDATIKLAKYMRSTGVAICSEAYGLNRNGEWNMPLITACPVLAQSRYLQNRDPNNTLVVPDGCEVHLILKTIKSGTDIDWWVGSLRDRGFIVGSGHPKFDKYAILVADEEDEG